MKITFKNTSSFILFLIGGFITFLHCSLFEKKNEVNNKKLLNDRIAMILENIEKIGNLLEPLSEKLPDPKPGDWLSAFPEKGQTFAQYREIVPVPFSTKSKIIYIQKIGDFSQGQEKLFNLTTDFLQKWFGLEVKILKPVSLENIPQNAVRVHPLFGDKQILTHYILNKVLLPENPADSAGLLGLTASDLWPGEGWNFVFGQASLNERIGVWSVYRMGNPDGSPEEFLIALKRTLKTAVHEFGHMLGMLHCIKYNCVMNGSNSLAESDRRPLALCPQCIKKVLWATGVSPYERFNLLASFFMNNGLYEDEKLAKKSMEAIKEFKSR